MSKITVGGLVATGLYVIVIAWHVIASGQKVSDLALNELGDFLAGVLGPLAFFWLICGYLQQGIELQQNTRALELQVQELHNSVEQQRALVEVTKEHALLEMDEIKRLREQARRAALPAFLARTGGSFHGDGDAHLKLNITNIGSEVRHIGFSTPYGLPPTIESFKTPDIPIWGRDATHVVSWSVTDFNHPGNFLVALSYVDYLGNPGIVNFAVLFSPESGGGAVRFKTTVEHKDPA
jgi:hypothetical protein